MNILFVCTGNTCRSPMAMEYAKTIYPQWEIRSAGLFALGDPISQGAKKTLEKVGIVSNHCSQPVTASLLQWADAIITMTGAHKNQILRQDPTLLVYTLKEAAGGHGDIQDPFGGSAALYEQTFQEIKKDVENLKLWEK